MNTINTGESLLLKGTSPYSQIGLKDRTEGGHHALTDSYKYILAFRASFCITIAYQNKQVTSVRQQQKGTQM